MPIATLVFPGMITLPPSLKAGRTVWNDYFKGTLSAKEKRLLPGMDTVRT